MSTSCADIVDRLPDWAAGRVVERDEADRIAEHLAGCAECAAEAELLRGLIATRRAAPADLAGRIVRAARAEGVAAPANRRPAAARPARRLIPAWGLPAAAVLVLAIGTTLLSRRFTSVPADSTAAAASPVAAVLGEVPVEDDSGVENAVWISDDGVVAGAPVFDELSDDNLAALLEEMGG